MSHSTPPMFYDTEVRGPTYSFRSKHDKQSNETIIDYIASLYTVGCDTCLKC